MTAKLLEACKEAVNFLETWKDVLLSNMPQPWFDEMVGQLETAIDTADEEVKP